MLAVPRGMSLSPITFQKHEIPYPRTLTSYQLVHVYNFYWPRVSLERERDLRRTRSSVITMSCRAPRIVMGLRWGPCQVGICMVSKVHALQVSSILLFMGPIINQIQHKFFSGPIFLDS